MSKQDVINYVMHTPYNANEAVLRSLLEDLGGDGAEMPAFKVPLDEIGEPVSITTTMANSILSAGEGDLFELYGANGIGVLSYINGPQSNPFDETDNNECYDITFAITNLDNEEFGFVNCILDVTETNFLFSSDGFEPIESGSEPSVSIASLTEKEPEEEFLGIYCSIAGDTSNKFIACNKLDGTTSNGFYSSPYLILDEYIYKRNDTKSSFPNDLYFEEYNSMGFKGQEYDTVTIQMQDSAGNPSAGDVWIYNNIWASNKTISIDNGTSIHCEAIVRNAGEVASVLIPKLTGNKTYYLFLGDGSTYHIVNVTASRGVQQQGSIWQVTVQQNDVITCTVRRDTQ